MNDDYSAFMGHNSDAELIHLNELAEAQWDAELKVERLEKDLEDAKKELREYSDKLVPEKMDALGIASHTTQSGVTIEVQEHIRASLGTENKPRKFAWLEANGAGGLIKSEVVIPFKRNELGEAQKMVVKLTKEGKTAILERRIEPSTYSAYVREQLTQGKDFPLDLFPIYRQRISKVSYEKKE